MGFLRLLTKVKNGKAYNYFYFCERRRSRIRDGGNGKIRAIDKLLTSPWKGLTSDRSACHFTYLDFWLWDGLNLQDYTEALCQWELRERYGIEDLITFNIEWAVKKQKVTAGKIKFRSVPGSGFDARSRIVKGWEVKRVRFELQKWIDSLIKAKNENVIDKSIRDIAYYLATFQKYNKEKIKEEEHYLNWQKKTDARPDRSHAHYLVSIETKQYLSDHGLKTYQKKMALIERYAPPKERERFKADVIRQTEKLAADPTFLDRYDCKN